MIYHQYLNFIFVIILLMLSFNLGTHLQKKSIQIKAKSTFLAPPKNIEKFVFGFNEIVADSLWIRWIQNVDECGKDLISRNEIIQNKLSADKVSEVIKNLDETQRERVCDQGWAFHMLDAVSDLSPKFRAPYSVGATTLSVISEDHIGAKKIYQKAIKNYPADWNILYRAAYHYIYELNEYEEGSKLLVQAVKAGAPDWLYALSSRISTMAGKVDFGITVLYQYLETVTNEDAREEILQKIENLKKQIKNK